jgi:FKBP-type peptidyl-prolyl cis-trans isomerase SlpA
MDKINVRDITGLGDIPEPENTGYDAGQVCSGRQVTLHFELALANGDIVDSNFDGEAATFRIGDGNLPAGFEQVLFGLRAGDEHSAELEAEDAFGPRNPDNIHTFPRYRFPADLAMEEGLVINFADSAGNDQAGVITAFDADRVTVDFNHPLAGKTIRFRVKILSVYG